MLLYIMCVQLLYVCLYLAYIIGSRSLGGKGRGGALDIANALRVAHGLAAQHKRLPRQESKRLCWLDWKIQIKF